MGKIAKKQNQLIIFLLMLLRLFTAFVSFPKQSSREIEIAP